jgi:hypothetical protein
MTCAKTCHRLRLIAALSLLTISSGCLEAHRSAAPVNISDPPAVLTPEPKPNVVGLHPLLGVKILSKWGDRANARIKKGAQLWRNMKERYGKARL